MKSIARVLMMGVFAAIFMVFMVSLPFAQPHHPDLPVQKTPELPKPIDPGIPKPKIDVPLFLPDLIITALGPAEGSPRIVGNTLEFPFFIRVKNQGTASAGRFKVAVEQYNSRLMVYEVVPFTCIGQRNPSFPFSDADLPPGRYITFTGKLIFPSAVRGFSVRVTVDSTAGDPSPSPFGMVRESNEGNNVTSFIRTRIEL